MSDTISVDSKQYAMDANPSLGTVRQVQTMQMNILKNHLTEDDIEGMDSLESESEIIQAVIDKEGFEGFQEVMWEQSMLKPVQTISLACDEPLKPDDFDDMGSKDFKEARENAEEILGGDATDFFEDLGIGSFLNEEEMMRRAQAKQGQTET